jgi:hypothetical protein
MSTNKKYLYPGNRSNMREYIRNSYLNEYYNLQKDILVNRNGECNCIQFRANPIKQGYNDPNQTEAQRISQIINSSLGGRTTFGNIYGPVLVNEIGGAEGQSGGLPRPLRNKF